MEILDCYLDNAALAAWQGHFAPTTQPFFARRRFPLPDQCASRWLDRRAARDALSLSEHDTFATYEVTGAARHLLLLDEGAFRALPPELRAELLVEQREVGRGSVFRLREITDHLTRSEVDQVTAASPSGLVVWWPGLFAALSEATRARLLASFASEDRPPCNTPPSAWVRAKSSTRRLRPGGRRGRSSASRRLASAGGTSAP